MGGAKKKLQKIIPKEIKPALPAIAAIGLPYLAGAGTFGTKIATLAAKSPGIAAAIANAATQAATQDKFDIKSAALSGLQAGIGAKLQTAGTGEFLKGSPKTASFLRSTGKVLNPASAKASFIGPSQALSFDTALGTASAIGKGALPVASYDAAQDIKELNEKALRDYEAQLREQGIMDSAERRNAIFGYFSRAGYGDDEINSMLDKYGYADGGRVGFNQGGAYDFSYFDIDDLQTSDDNEGGITTLKDLMNNVKSKLAGLNENKEAMMARSMSKKRSKKINLPSSVDGSSVDNSMAGFKLANKAFNKNDDDFDADDILNAIKGLEYGYGRPIDMKPTPTRFGLAEGGIPNVMAMRKTIAELIASGVIDEEDVEEAVAQIRNQAMMSMRAPGMAEGGIMNLGGKEMDMRGGGFIPIGAKERADDVPARLSKNEFVMTADAVRAAGGGSINKGAKRMYDLMNKLESKV